MTKIFRYTAVVVFASLFMTGCFLKKEDNKPVVKLDILSITAEGLSAEPEINADNFTAVLPLAETTDIRNVHITDMQFTEGAKCKTTFPAYFDLRVPLYVTLSKYQKYEWTITSTQHIERYFHVEGEMREATIDVDNRIATAYVPMGTDLDNVTITSLKLGPEGITTYNPNPLEFTTFEGSIHQVEVCYHDDIEELWTLRVEPAVEVELSSADAWAKRIWLKGQGRSGTELGFKYRKVGDEAWSMVEDVTVDGGSFSACVTGLETLTEYEVLAFSDDNETDAVRVTTEDTFTLVNGGMEEWSFSSKCYYPYASSDTAFWGTGNPGATTLGEDYNLTTPNSKDLRPGTSGTKSANLQSMYPNMAGIGKFAAGNLFAGRYAGTNGTNGVIHFGRPCTARPVALHGWVKYERGKIDKVGGVPASRPDLAVGSPDEGQILVAVGDWTPEVYGGTAESPIAIDTRYVSTFFNKNGDNVIGVGEIILTESTDGWWEFTLPLEYKSYSRIPTHVVLVFSCSRYGDYFTGSTKSKMVIDDLELVY